jgi:hypothetical protein
MSGREVPKSFDRRLVTALAWVLMAGLLLVVLARFVSLQRAASGLGLAAGDNYASVVRKLGPAAEERARPPYRALWYPRRSRYVVLRDGRYIGLLDSNWRVIAYTNGDTASVLRTLPRF